VLEPPGGRSLVLKVMVALSIVIEATISSSVASGDLWLHLSKAYFPFAIVAPNLEYNSSYRGMSNQAVCDMYFV